MSELSNQLPLIIRCKCKHLEYEDNARWLSGGPWCRHCYRKIYEAEYGRKYTYNDLDTFIEPSEQMYERQMRAMQFELNHNIYDYSLYTSEGQTK